MSRRASLCDVQRARGDVEEGRKEGQTERGDKKLDLAGSKRRNARHPQFSGNQRRECFVAVQGDEPDAPFIPRCHRRIISPRTHTRTPQPLAAPPRASEAGEARSRMYALVCVCVGYLRGARDKHKLGLRFRKIAPRRPRGTLVCPPTIYGRRESLKNERAVQWRLCMMIKKSCLQVRARARARRFDRRVAAKLATI